MRYRNLFNTALGLSLFCLPLAIIPEAFARVGDDAVVLPKGYSRLFFDAEFYIPFEKRYDSNGNVEALGADFNTNLNSSVFPALAGFGPGATLGQSVVSYKRYLQQYLLQPAYGLTDRLTIGANIPYVSIKNDIGASLDTSGATVGKSPFSPFPSMLAPCSAPGCATGGPIPGTTPLTTNDVQNLLASQGFKPIKTWENSGFGDVEVGGRYQYFRSEFFRSAFTGGVRFPTGYADDPNNLVDTAWGGGTYALLFRFNQDFMYQKEGLGKRLGFPDPWTGFINTTFSYDWNLPNSQTMHVCSPRAPVCANQGKVDRKLGDMLQAEISGKLGVFFPGLIFSPVYIYGYKFKDAYSGDQNLPYGNLAIDTSQTQNIYILTLTYTSIPAFVQKQFPFPFFASVSYRDRFAGTNAVKSQFVGFTLAGFF